MSNLSEGKGVGKESAPGGTGSRTALWLLFLLIAATLLLALAGPYLLGGRKNSRSMQKPASSHVASARGVVEGGEEIELSARVAGRIARVLVEEGDSVSKGQLLVQMDDAEELARLAQAKANLSRSTARLRELEQGYRIEDIAAAVNAYKKSAAVYEQAVDEHKRQQRLYDKDATTLVELNRATERLHVTESSMKEAWAQAEKFRKGERSEQVEQGRAMTNEARSAVDLSDARMKYHRIMSPIEGIVVDRVREPGESVDIGTPILVLITPSKMRIRAELEENDVGKVTEGQRVTVTSDTFPGKTITGKVTKVVPAVRKKTQKNFDPMASFDINTQKIFIQLDDWRGLNHGMTVMVWFGR